MKRLNKFLALFIVGICISTLTIGQSLNNSINNTTTTRSNMRKMYDGIVNYVDTDRWDVRLSTGETVQAVNSRGMIESGIFSVGDAVQVQLTNNPDVVVIRPAGGPTPFPGPAGGPTPFPGPAGGPTPFPGPAGGPTPFPAPAGGPTPFPGPSGGPTPFP